MATPPVSTFEPLGQSTINWTKATRRLFVISSSPTGAFVSLAPCTLAALAAALTTRTILSLISTRPAAPSHLNTRRRTAAAARLHMRRHHQTLSLLRTSAGVASRARSCTALPQASSIPLSVCQMRIVIAAFLLLFWAASTVTVTIPLPYASLPSTPPQPLSLVLQVQPAPGQCDRDRYPCIPRRFQQPCVIKSVPPFWFHQQIKVLWLVKQHTMIC
jgi:hypothetical protein